MTQIFNHRAADVVTSLTALQRKAQPNELTHNELFDPKRSAIPLYWISKIECKNAVGNNWAKKWLLGFTSVTSPTNERTMNPSLFPFCGAGNSMPILVGIKHIFDRGILYAIMCSYSFDYIVRQKIGGVNLNFYLVNQITAITPKILTENAVWKPKVTIKSWLLARVLELTYTAWDLQPFANDCGFDGLPFRWDEDRRFLLRCELDAAFFHLYLPANANCTWKKGENETDAELAALCATFPTPRHAVAYIMDTFPIVKRKDEAKYGEYRTKRTILEIYDAMQHAITTGQPYQTRLDPPPGDRRCCHPEKSPEQA